MIIPMSGTQADVRPEQETGSCLGCPIAMVGVRPPGCGWLRSPSLAFGGDEEPGGRRWTPRRMIAADDWRIVEASSPNSLATQVIFRGVPGPERSSCATAAVLVDLPVAPSGISSTNTTLLGSTSGRYSGSPTSRVARSCSGRARTISRDALPTSGWARRSQRRDLGIAVDQVRTPIE